MIEISRTQTESVNFNFSIRQREIADTAHRLVTCTDRMDTLLLVMTLWLILLAFVVVIGFVATGQVYEELVFMAFRIYFMIMCYETVRDLFGVRD